jgi:6-phosphofructokinase 1
MATGRIGILTSGGDAPGMNAAIRAATLMALRRGREVVGIESGFRGLVQGLVRPLTADDVGAIHRDGGTLLGSSRCPEFYQDEVRLQACRQLAAHEVEDLIIIGGNGSLGGGKVLMRSAEGVIPLRVIGIPASIDNDIGYTSRAIGVDTAMNTIVEAVDKIADTADAHQRTFIIEVMGRDSGYLAMASAMASGADMVLFPEAGRSEDEVVESVVRAVKAVRSRSAKRKRVIAIKAEGLKVPLERLKTRIDARLRELGEGNEFETRATVLGHIVRGGRPSAFDRLLAARLANSAVEALTRGEGNLVVGWQSAIDPPAQVARRSPTDPYCWLIDLDAVLVETKAMLEGKTHNSSWRVAINASPDDVFVL